MTEADRLAEYNSQQSIVAQSTEVGSQRIRGSIVETLVAIPALGWGGMGFYLGGLMGHDLDQMVNRATPLPIFLAIIFMIGGLEFGARIFKIRR